MPSPFYYGDPGAQRGLSDLPRFPKQPIGAVAGAGPPCSSHHTGSVQLKVEGSGSLGLDGNASSFPPKTPAVRTLLLLHPQDSEGGTLHPLQPGAEGGADAQSLATKPVGGKWALRRYPCDMTCQQDLITALVNREKVQLPSPTQSVLTLPPPPAQPSLTSDPLVKVSVCSKICSGPLDCQAPQQSCQSCWFHPFLLQEAPPLPSGSAHRATPSL